MCATPVFAGTLASDGSAFFGDDPVTVVFDPILWSGSTAYVGTVPPADLFGDIEWAVYAPGTFPAVFTGYTPDPTHFVYAFQLFEDGSAPASLFSVVLINPATDIGTFTGGGVSGDPATTEVLLPFDSATWEFAGIGAGGSSVGLAFSSPFSPTMGFGVVLDDGEVGPVIPLPTPSNVIPEPATWTLAVLGLFGFVVASLRRRGRRVSRSG